MMWRGGGVMRFQREYERLRVRERDEERLRVREADDIESKRDL